MVSSEGLGDVLADPSQLTQLFQNLIGNAIKFCDRRPPRVDIRADYGEHEVTFSVSDNGVGIAPDVDIMNAPSLGMKLVRTLTEATEAIESHLAGKR